MVTMLFTDIEDSNVLARALGGGWREVPADQHEVVARAIEGHRGYGDRLEGDSFFALFADARDAVAAALDANTVPTSCRAATPGWDGAERIDAFASWEPFAQAGRSRATARTAPT
jgi:class 3 adenylate cyclase